MKFDCTGSNLTNRGEAFSHAESFMNTLRAGELGFTIETKVDASGNRSMVISSDGKRAGDKPKKKRKGTEAQAPESGSNSQPSGTASNDKQVTPGAST